MTAVSRPPVPAAVRMARRLTVPFARGADTLVLSLRAGDATLATVDSYDFAEHVAQFDRQPEPRYVLAAASELVAETLVTVTYVDQGAPVDVRITVPARTRAGASFQVPVPVSASGRITRLTMSPPAPGGSASAVWTLTALLGNLAKLLWVVGAERDALRGHAARTVAQRHLPTAEGPSLDLIGIDLGVPRFPPLPYGFDAATVALYHLDDPASTAPAVADATAGHPGRTGHPGTQHGAVQRGATGRYGPAFGFPGTGAWVEVATTPDLDIPAAAGATIECFVRPDPDADGPLLTRHPAPGGAGAGWVLAVGGFGRGVPRSVRFTIADSARSVDVFADVTLPTDAFTHVAAVLDRAGNRVALFLDGRLRGTTPLGQFGAVVSTAPLRIGPAIGGFHGLVDEVRISSVPRADFAPTLGEGDEHYRRRLRLFRRWTLPTPATLTGLLNELAGPIGGHDDALIVDDSNATLVRGTRLVHVRPVALRPGECVDAAGRRRVREASVVGTALDEDAFDPAFLFRYDRVDVDFAVPRPGSAADPHLVQIGLVDRLDRLAALAGAETSPPGRLLVGAAFDPAAADLRATGRAVLLGHSTVAPDRLAALAHRIGFDFVCHRAGGGPAPVYAASARGDAFAIALDPAGAGPTDLDVGGVAALTLRPAPPPDAFVRWLVVPGGAGRGRVDPDTGPSTPQRSATLHATAAGRLVVKADVTRGRHTSSATRVLRVGLADLADGATISGDGTPGTPPSVVDDPETFFHPAFLVRHDDQRVNYGTVEDHHRMQPAVAELLDALLAELARRGVTGQLSVTAAFDANGDAAATQGRRLVLRHSALGPGALAAVAFAVGFGHLQRTGNDLQVRQAPGQLVAIRGPAGAEGHGIITVDEGSTVDLTASPTPAALTAAGQTPAVLGWASGAFDDARISLGSVTQPAATLTATSAGMAWVQASYLIGTAPAPYTFAVRLRPELDTPATVISKDQHDLIMNVLNALRPVGVEVITAAIRSHVVEVQGDQLLQANPEYTYPKFRVRGVLPRQVRGSARG